MASTRDPARPTRGRMSRIQQLPQPIKDRLDELLRAGVPQTEILRVTAPLLDAAGAQPLSQSGLNRYATRMEAVGRRIREARAAAAAWTAKFGEAPTGELGQHVIEILRGLSLDLSLDAQDNDDPSARLENLAQLALAVQRLERAAGMSAARERALRSELAERAAAEAEEAARRQSAQTGHVLPPEALRAIREQVYGIVDHD